ncbi:methyltransferase domain-containing protein [Ottowia testudinis]|uniref:Methyltransferase domain-containing protein n=2 Tax=Ottowia testudinis TaxID=2816950 RepID=A0A975CJ59_9BURK|nr:methyltransferase domain-containing protein [Ottowia testudinis]
MPLLTGDAGPTSVGRSARFWNRVARKYAAAPIADLPGYERTLDQVRPWLGPEHTVLEIGCGTGATALRLAPASGHWLATDVSPEMIAIARERLHAQPTPQLAFAVADAGAALAPPAAFDRVLAFNVLHLVDDLAQTLAAAARALRPGGLLISKTPCVAELNPLITRLAIPLARAVGKAPPVLVFSEADLRRALDRSGLCTLTVERHGTRGKDMRVFIVARKEGDSPSTAPPTA